jgi:hypothetical protein
MGIVTVFFSVWIFRVIDVVLKKYSCFQLAVGGGWISHLLGRHLSLRRPCLTVSCLLRRNIIASILVPRSIGP